MKVPYAFAPAHLDRQRAATVAALAWAYYLEKGDDCMISADEFRPEYLRLAQAEQEHSERRSFSLLLDK
jgi:tRNA threonylcarbamoyladenosine biosynthesis protein TsaB